MAEITVPQALVDEPFVQGGDRPFPAGTWAGTIEDVNIQDFPEWASNPTNNGYENAVGQTLSLQICDNVALGEDQDDPGNQRFFAPSSRENWVIQDGDLMVWDVDPDERDVKHWRLQRAYRGLVQLGAALGAATQNGESYSLDLEAFVNGLMDGVYDGQRIAYVTIHRPFKRKDGEKGVEVMATQFMSAP